MSSIVRASAGKTDRPKVAMMKDSEFGESDFLVTPRCERTGTSLVKKVLSGGAIILGFIVLVFGIGLVASHCDRSFHAEAELLHAEHMVSEAAHELAIRGECNESGGMFGCPPDVLPVKVAGSSGFATGTYFRPSGTVGTVGGTAYSSRALEESTSQAANSSTTPVVFSVPISTQTAITTIYSFQTTLDTAVRVTMTTTKIISVTRAVSVYQSEADDCSGSLVTETVSVFVTVSPLPDRTVTAGASTATRVDTDVSLTNGLPDVTLSGNPSTRTAVQTDVSLTRGPPDATVSGSPETVTDVKTDVSLTAGLPDATVSGDPSTVTNVEASTSAASYSVSAFTTLTITNLWGSLYSSPSAKTDKETDTIKGSAFLTLTISDLYPHSARDTSSTSASGFSSVLGEDTTASSSSPMVGAITETVYTTWTGGPAATSITTVHVPPGKNASSSTTAAAGTTVVVSDGGKKPEPKGWGGGNGSGNLGCTVMLIAVVMFLL